jgi:hypothetical protein
MARFLVLALLGLATLLVHAQEGTRGEFLYAVRVDPQGRVLTIEAQGDLRVPAVPAAIEPSIREQLLARTYVRTDSRGGTLTTWLEGKFDTTAQGGGSPPSITELRAGPRAVRIDSPHSPAALVRDRIEADLLLSLKLASNGTPTIVAIDGLDALGAERAQRLREKIEHVAKGWRFQPERWDGRPIESELRLAIQYRIGLGADSDWAWRGSAPTQAGSLQVPAETFRPLTIGLRAKRR